MPLFGGKKDKWEEQRNDLIARAKGSKDYLTTSPDQFFNQIVYVSPDAEAFYSPYLAYLSGNWRYQEKPKFPEDVLDCCCLRLLGAATVAKDFVPQGWSFNLDTLAFKDMTLNALPLLDTLVSELIKRQYYELVYKNYLGTFLALVAGDARSDPYTVKKLVPGGGWAAETRGYYAQGLAALQSNDLNQAKTSWELGEISGNYAKDEPTYNHCKEGLAKLK
jgi:hypothetical protein